MVGACVLKAQCGAYVSGDYQQQKKTDGEGGTLGDQIDPVDRLKEVLTRSWATQKSVVANSLYRGLVARPAATWQNSM